MDVKRRYPKRFWEDKQWAIDNHTDLVEKYPDLWVAVVNKTVIAAGDSIKKIKEEARHKTGESYIPVFFVESSANIYES